jgi:transcriptional regulator with XRE-family HTH domain
MVPILSAPQCRMARAALEWGVRDLAAAAKVSADTVARFERGDLLKDRTVEALQRALSEAGVVFIPENGGGVGVRLRKAARDSAGESGARAARHPRYAR